MTYIRKGKPFDTILYDGKNERELENFLKPYLGENIRVISDSAKNCQLHVGSHVQWINKNTFIWYNSHYSIIETLPSDVFLMLYEEKK